MQRVALIGAGTMGRTHYNAWCKIGNAEVVAVCDINREKAELLTGKCGVRIYDEYQKMMEAETFDILDICLPTYLHAEYAINAMKKGKHVFCEKPVALTEEDAVEMISTAKEYGVYFSVGHVLRFFPSYENAAQQCHDGRIGVPRLIRTTRNQGFPRWSWNNWYQDYSKSGGPILDLVIHDFDWIIANFGPVERVYASSFDGKIEGQEHCLCILRLKNGAICHVEGSWAFPQGTSFRMTYEIVGTEGSVEYDSVKNAPIWVQTNQEGAHIDEYINPMLGEMEPYMRELKAFSDAVENKTPPVISGEAALSALRVALAAVKSSQSGEAVTIQEDVR